MEKITVQFECPNCHIQKKLKKAPEMASGKIICPNCNSVIKIVFNTNADPQTVVSTSLADKPKEIQPPIPSVAAKKETVYGNVDNIISEQIKQDPATSVPLQNKKATTYADVSGITPPDYNSHKRTVVVDELKNQPRLNQNIFVNRLGKRGKKIIEKYQIFDGTITIGRQDPVQVSDIMFDNDPEMSRRSVQLSVIPTYQGVVCRLKVLKATNPVTIGTHVLVTGEEIAVSFNEEILLGKTRIIITDK